MDFFPWVDCSKSRNLPKCSEKISKFITFKEKPLRTFLQGCSFKLFCDKGCKGTFGLLKLAKGLDSGLVISWSLAFCLLISGELVVNCNFWPLSTKDTHLRKNFRCWKFSEAELVLPVFLGETPEVTGELFSRLLKSSFRRSCLATWGWGNIGEAPLLSLFNFSLSVLMFINNLLFIKLDMIKGLGPEAGTADVEAPEAEFPVGATAVEGSDFESEEGRSAISVRTMVLSRLFASFSSSSEDASSSCRSSSTWNHKYFLYFAWHANLFIFLFGN